MRKGQIVKPTALQPHQMTLFPGLGTVECAAVTPRESAEADAQKRGIETCGICAGVGYLQRTKGFDEWKPQVHKHKMTLSHEYKQCDTCGGTGLKPK